MKRHSLLSFAVILAVGLAAVGTGCGKSDTPAATGKGSRGGGGNKLEYPVQVAAIENRALQYTVTAPGSLDAFQQVQITSRVAGAVDKVSFSEGETVTVDQVLVTIELDRFEVAVDQAQTALAKAAANLKSAQAELARRQQATSETPGLIPGEEIEQHATAVDTAKADLDTAKQALKVAQLNLRDASVHAPIAGVVQTRTVQTGQYLVAGTVLATIQQRDPLLLRFQVTEQEAPRLKPGMIATLALRESKRQYPAKLTLVAGAADPATRLVPVTAEVDDTDHQYWLRPGAFCEVTVPVDAPRQAIVVPGLAVSPTELGNVVFTVDAKNIAHQKLVQLGMHTADGGIEVTQGLNVGDLLVVRGVEPLSEGAPVKISEKISLAQAQAPDAGVPPASAPIPATSAPATSAPASDPAQASRGGHHRDAGVTP